MAISVAIVWAMGKSTLNTLNAVAKARKCTTTPLRPTQEKRMNRAGTMWPNCLSTMSSKYSQTTAESSLLSPAVRSRKVYGTSIKDKGSGEEATFSQDEFSAMLELGKRGVAQLVAAQREVIEKVQRS